MYMKKYLLKSFALIAMLFSALTMSAKKYCQESLTLNLGATIQLSCELVSAGNYRITIEGENLNGLGGSFYNPGAVDLRTKITSSTATKIVCDIEAASAPTLYTPLFVLCPGEQNIGWPTDIDWTGRCGEGSEVPVQPTPESIIESTYFAPDWVEDGKSSATYDANTGTITVDIQSQLLAQWQGQVKVKHDVAFSADKYYQFSAKFHANKAVNGVTIKVDDNNGMIFENASVNLPANSDYIYTSAIVKGIPGNNKIIVFDFGYASPCQITISDILLQEVDKPADNEKPVLHSATLVDGSETHNSAVLEVSATDNVKLAGIHVVDATNNYDKTFELVDGKITLTDLTPSTTYNFTVTAVDDSGNVSETSISVSVSTIALI